MRPDQAASRTIAVALLCAAMTCLAAGGAEAKVRMIWPSGFEETAPGSGKRFFRTSALIQGSSANVSGVAFTAQVRLPTGARITGVKLSGAGGDFFLFLGRKRLVGPEETVIFERVSAPGGAWELLPVSIAEGADTHVRPGYRYYLVVTVLDSAQFGGVQISYR